MTRDDLLLWLSDRCGREVEAELVLERGDLSVVVMTALGELRHWSEEDSERVVGAKMLGPRDDVIGWYSIGDASIDVTDVKDHEAIEVEGKVEIDLALEHTVLRIHDRSPEE